MAISAGRVFAGGLIAGGVRLVGGGIAQALVLAPLFGEEINRNHPRLVATMETTPAKLGMVAINLLLGIATIYVYAAIRPRFATRVAAVTGAAAPTWLIAVLQWEVTALMGLFSQRHIVVQSLVTLVPVLVGAYAGSLVYREANDAPSAKASRRSATASTQA